MRPLILASLACLLSACGDVTASNIHGEIASTSAGIARHGSHYTSQDRRDMRRLINDALKTRRLPK